jgi:hypothetical protein
MAASLTDGTLADITPYATFQSADDFIAPIKDISGVQPVKVHSLVVACSDLLNVLQRQCAVVCTMLRVVACC